MHHSFQQNSIEQQRSFRLVTEKQKELEKNTPTTSTPTTKEGTRPYSRTTHTSSQPCGQQGDKHNRKIERTKESLQHHHVQSNKNSIYNNNKPKKKCNKEASAEEAEENTPKAPGI
jgi:hypothetical protein